MSFGMFQEARVEKATKKVIVASAPLPHIASKPKVVEKIVEKTVEVLRGELCPKCGKPLIVKKNSFTKRLFVGCSSWPACTHTMSIAEDIGSARGARGVAELCNGVQVFYAETMTVLRAYKGMKEGDLGIIIKNYGKKSGVVKLDYKWTDGGWEEVITFDQWDGDGDDDWEDDEEDEDDGW